MGGQGKGAGRKEEAVEDETRGEERKRWLMPGRGTSGRTALPMRSKVPGREMGRLK